MTREKKTVRAAARRLSIAGDRPPHSGEPRANRSARACPSLPQLTLKILLSEKNKFDKPSQMWYYIKTNAAPTQ